MGLTGFYQLLQKRGGYVPSNLSLSDLKGKTVALDGDFVLYKALHGHTNGERVEPMELAEQVAKWLVLAVNNGIKPIFVTTGGPPPIEKQTHCSVVRKRKRDRTQQTIDKLENQLKIDTDDIGTELHLRDKICRLRNSIRRISSEMTAQVVTILSGRGFVCRQAKSEADFLLVMMSEDGQCDFVATDDADIIVSGATHVLRGFIRMLVNTTLTGAVFCRQDVLACLGLSSPELLQLGTLLACDYQPPILNVGPVTALRMIQEHKTVDAFLHSESFLVETSKQTHKKRKYTLPRDMSVESYVTASRRSVSIFRSRPDKIHTHTIPRDGTSTCEPVTCGPTTVRYTL
jgi:flap endonuclease-1